MPRKKKDPVASTEAVSAVPADAAEQAVTDLQPAQPNSPVDAAAPPQESAAAATDVARPERNGAPPRRDGRIAQTIAPDKGYERLKSPAGEIVFAFKRPPTEEQMALIRRYEFGYDEVKREAFRANDIRARTAADKLDFYLSGKPAQLRA